MVKIIEGIVLSGLLKVDQLLVAEIRGKGKKTEIRHKDKNNKIPKVGDYIEAFTLEEGRCVRGVLLQYFPKSKVISVVA